MLAGGSFTSAAILMAEMEFPSSRLAASPPVPVTTTSSRLRTLRVNSALAVVEPPGVTATVTCPTLKPMANTRSTRWPAGTTNLNRPSSPVVTPRLVPCTDTWAPEMGPPPASVTRPLTVPVCARAAEGRGGALGNHDGAGGPALGLRREQHEGL